MLHIRFDPDHHERMILMTKDLKKRRPELTLYLDNVDALLHDWEELLRVLDLVTEGE